MKSSEIEGEQTPFEIVHLNTFAPNPNEDIAELASVELKTDPVPDITDHNPEPIAGVLPAKIELEEQID